MTLLDIRDLSLRIGATPILDGVSLTVGPGEIVAITGESGSGKSMTALATMGLTPDRALATGQILLEGADILKMEEDALCRIRGARVGMVFQEPMTALNPLMTIGAQVAEVIRIHAPDRDAGAEAQAMLDRVGLPADRFPPTRYPHELSGGQRQRVVIAMAIALRPKLLIADEPTTALDVTTQARILDLLRDLTRDFGMGLMMISHDLAVVAQMADRIVVMQKGRVVEQGPMADVLHHQRHPYTRALLAASAHAVNLPEPPTPAPLLEVRQVTRSYARPRRGLFTPGSRIPAVQDVSFTLQRGERLGLVGESGCGKSTLTRAILGLEPVQVGTITLNGAPVWTDRHANLAVRRQMQVVFQDPYSSFNPRHRVDRLITEPFHLLPDPPLGAARAKKVAEALTAVGLSPADADKYPHEFSGGQRQRIAIARALINDPALIVFDEPVSALDVSVRAQVLDLLADLCRARPLSYLFISHDIGVVRSITDRVMIMQAGRIVEQGPTAQVFDAPQHPYTRALLAAVPQLPDLTGLSHGA